MNSFVCMDLFDFGHATFIYRTLSLKLAADSTLRQVVTQYPALSYRNGEEKKSLDCIS